MSVNTLTQSTTTTQVAVLSLMTLDPYSIGSGYLPPGQPTKVESGHKTGPTAKETSDLFFMSHTALNFGRKFFFKATLNAPAR